jgi:ribonuclease D
MTTATGETSALRPFPSVPYEYITDVDRARDVLAALVRVLKIGFDLETAAALDDRDPDRPTALDPHRNRPRLASLTVARPEPHAYLIDLFAVPPTELVPLLTGTDGPMLVGHNLQFDIGVLLARGLPVPSGRRFGDSMLASQLLWAGLPSPPGTHTLAGVVKRTLRMELAKDEQRSDWGAAALSPEQLAYAARDAAAALDLHRVLVAHLIEAGLDHVYDLECRCLPALAALWVNGALLDAERWTRLALLA